MSDGPRQADLLVDLALERYRLGCSADGEPFAVEIEGANIARLFRGRGGSLRSELAEWFHDVHGKAPTANSLSDAMLVLEGQARRADRTSVHLRVAGHENTVVIDLGTADGTAVVVDADGWRTTTLSPVLFRRTALTGALPAPESGGDLDDLRDLLNIDRRLWPLAVAWLVAALMPTIPHPILALLGEQGTGKSTFARLLTRLIDPSPAQLRTAPRDVDTWVVAASGSWVVALDNLSSIKEWMSDALCRAATGDGLVRRRLYSDDDLSVLAFRRVVALTSIDAGALRGDLADRLLVLDLTRIDPTRRRLDADLEARFLAAWPALFGAMLDLTAKVLGVLPAVHLARPPRMADFARVVAAVDEVLGTDALDRYAAQGERMAEDVIESSPLAAAVRDLAGLGPWTGTAADLYKRLTPDRVPDSWPKSPRGLSGALTRAMPALRSVGVEVTRHERSGAARLITVREEGKPPSQPSQPSSAPETQAHIDDGRPGSTVTDDPATVTDRHPPSHETARNPGRNDGHDANDGRIGTHHPEPPDADDEPPDDVPDHILDLAPEPERPTDADLARWEASDTGIDEDGEAA